jgi:hypothetical protein
MWQDPLAHYSMLGQAKNKVRDYTEAALNSLDRDPVFQEKVLYPSLSQRVSLFSG